MAFSAIRQFASGVPLALRMRQRTSALHTVAEGSGVVGALLAGQVSQLQYALYLRNLLPAYQAMELALRRSCSAFGLLAQSLVFREASIVADLDGLVGADWPVALPLLPTGQRYADRVSWAATGELLLGHCYTRYLGDLNGGQIIRRRLLRRFGPDFVGLAFTVFPAIEDVPEFAAAYRAALNRAGEDLSDPAAVVEEAAVAFQMNIALSQEVGAFG